MTCQNEYQAKPNQAIRNHRAPERKPIWSQKRLERKLTALAAIQTAYSAWPSSHLLSASSKSASRSPLTCQCGCSGMRIHKGE